MKVGMRVGIRSANLTPTLSPRAAEIIFLEDLPGYRRNRVEVRYEDSGKMVNLPLDRVVRLPAS